MGQYLQNQDLQKQSRLSISSDWNKLLEQNECLKKSDCIYPHHKQLSLVQEHNNLKESVYKLFEKPNALISLKFQMIYCLDICDINNQSISYWHHIDTKEKGSTLFTTTIDNEFLHVIEFTPNSDFMKFAKFQFAPEKQLNDHLNEGTSSQHVPQLSEKFPQMELFHSQFYNDKTLSMLFTYKKGNMKSNCFAQFPIQTIQTRLVSTRLKNRIVFDQSFDNINLRHLIDPDLIRPLDISDGNLIAVSGGRKIATIISSSRKKFYHFEMEVEEGDLDEEEEEEAEQSDNENDADTFEIPANE